jgi:hypothetical protein
VWEAILGSIAANALVLGILGYLLKSILSHWLDKDISKFKLEIEENANKVIASYQSELEKERIRLQISYGGIFEKQANAILELFTLAVEFEKSVQSATHVADNKSQAYGQFIECWRNLVGFYEVHKILMPESIEEIFEKFSNGTFWSVEDYRRAEQRISRHKITNDDLDKLFSRQDKALADLDQLPVLKKELTSRLRSLVGVH